MSKISGSQLHITIGTARTFEHLDSGFSFRQVGDGALEPVVLEKFSPQDSIAESLQDRRLRQFVLAESAFTRPENAVNDEEVGAAKLQEVVTSTLGQGWEVDAFYANGQGTANRTVVKYHSQSGASQTIDIEHRGEEKVTLKAEVSLNGWNVQQSVDAKLLPGDIDSSSVVEHGYFSKY